MDYFHQQEIMPQSDIALNTIMEILVIKLD